MTEFEEEFFGLFEGIEDESSLNNLISQSELMEGGEEGSDFGDFNDLNGYNGSSGGYSDGETSSCSGSTITSSSNTPPLSNINQQQKQNCSEALNIRS